MAVPTRITDFNTTAASNAPTGSESVGTSLDDYLRGYQAVVRLDLASKGSDIASTGTADLGAVGGLMHDITGTTTITGFGTVAAGIPKIVKFEGALTLTHNATSLILPGGANITTADGDVGIFISEGSGNWRCVSYEYATNGSVPVGSVMPYAGSTEPGGWLFCYGQAVSRSTYARLFAVISTTYGAGDESTTFNLPDLRGRVVAGQDDMGGSSANRLTGVTGSVNGDTLGGSGGEETHTLTDDEMPAHVHPNTTNANAGGGTSQFMVTGGGATSLDTGSAGSDDPHNNVQPTIILNYLIKT